MIYSQHPSDHTLTICFDKQKLEAQINSVLQDFDRTKASISDNNFIYITPTAEYNQRVTFDLSKILDAISKINILVVKIQDLQQDTSMIEIFVAMFNALLFAFNLCKIFR